jgi:hypothetical protein
MDVDVKVNKTQISFTNKINLNKGVYYEITKNSKNNFR